MGIRGGVALINVISETVEQELIDAFPNAEVIIHEDPEGVEEHRVKFR